MFCPNCGTNVPDGSKFCAGCGHPMQSSAPSTGGVEVRYSKPKAKPAEPVYAPPVPPAEPVYTPPVQAEPVYTPPAAPVQPPVYTPPAPSAPVKPKKATKKSKLPLIIVALVAIVGIVVGAVALLGGGKEAYCVAYEVTNSGDGYEYASKWEYEFDDDGNVEVYSYNWSYSYADYDDYNYASETEYEVEYDDKGNIETVTVSGDGYEYEFEYVYEGKELVEAVCEDGDITITATFEDGKVVSVERDDGNDTEEIASYEYDGDVLVEEVTKSGSYKYVYTYDEDGNLTESKTYYDGELTSSHTSTYNDEGDVIEEVSVNYVDGEKQTTTTTYEITYGKGGRYESVIMTIDYGDDTSEIEMVYEWDSDTECTITYEVDGVDEYYGGDSYAEQEWDKDGNVIYAAMYVDGELVNEATSTYQKLTKKQQEQIDQIGWILDLF